ncbi:MAG: GGDEF domain-containing protein [Gammaproteobacteria bacterium]|nr:GGDEF domain-containing protein [Gammaproteobacteria bacterium]
MGERESTNINIIIVSEQLQLIDLIENVLKKTYVVNVHQSNQVVEIKRILSRESIDVVIVDDSTDILGVGSISSGIKELRMNTPVLQLMSSDSEKSFGDFLNNGASLVCPLNDPAAILSCVKLLVSHSNKSIELSKEVGEVEGYRLKFEDLYLGLADPICYLADGTFVDCNPAFLRAFEVSDKDELQELTIMNFAERKAQAELKKHLKKSTVRDLSANPVVFQMQTKLGSAVEYVVMSKPAKFNDEDVVQVYMRSTSEGASGGAGLYDETTGLANKEQMGFFIKQKIEEYNSQGGQGVLAYLHISNYRDVWSSDGIEEAEKFILATTKYVRSNSPAHTEISRYTDDGLLLFIPKITAKEAEESLSILIKGLDVLTPEGMVRMVEALCYIGFDEINKDSNYQDLISQLFKTARSTAISGGARVSEPTANEVVKKDEKRLEAFQKVLTHERITLRYQPIASLNACELKCYRERVSFHDAQGELLDLDVLVNIGERYQLMRRLDRWKINHIFNVLLEIDSDKRSGLVMFISISEDSLKAPGFSSWLAEQMLHTGLGGQYFVFEIAADSAQNTYSGTKSFVKTMRENGAKIAISKIGNLSKDNVRIINDIQPEYIKLDIREIDTLDDLEEQEIMEDICQKAKDHNSILIAEYIECSAQLIRVWPYGIKFIQGDSMTPPMDSMSFDFNQFNLS